MHVKVKGLACKRTQNNYEQLVFLREHLRTLGTLGDRRNLNFCVHGIPLQEERERETDRQRHTERQRQTETDRQDRQRENTCRSVIRACHLSFLSQVS